MSPTTIHCSAGTVDGYGCSTVVTLSIEGIGRTGTIVGLDMMLTKLRSGQKVSLKNVSEGYGTCEGVR